jgi:tetratricopeptide (TPR) repeat protein
VHYQTGWLLLRTGRYAEATASFSEAARLQPDRAEPALALATTAMRARDLEQAALHAEQAVRLAGAAQPDVVADAHEIAARVALARLEGEKAAMHAEAAQQADESRPLVPFVRGRLLYEEAQYEEALEQLESAEAAASEHERPFEDLHASLGDTLARLNRYPEAEAQYREEIRSFPRNTRAYASLAMLYRASSRTRDLEEIIGDLVLAAPTPEGYAIAARLWTIAGDRTRAEALKADARTRFRGDPSLALLERAR